MYNFKYYNEITQALWIIEPYGTLLLFLTPTLRFHQKYLVRVNWDQTLSTDSELM